MFSSTEGVQRYVDGRKKHQINEKISILRLLASPEFTSFLKETIRNCCIIFSFMLQQLYRQSKGPRPRSGAPFYSAAVLVNQSIFNNCCFLIDETYAENVFVEEGSVETVYNVVHTEVSCLKEIVNVFIESVD